jgi:hypothetical protein
MLRSAAGSTKTEFNVAATRAYRVRSAILAASALGLATLASTPAHAQDAGTRLEAIEKKIQLLKAELRQMRERNAMRDREIRAAREAARPAPVATAMPQIPPGYALVPAAPGSTPGSVVLASPQPAAPPLPMGVFKVGNVSIKLGGFFAAEGAYRTRNEVEDIQSNFNTGIPLRSSPLYHEPETLLSARQTRITALITANPDPVTELASYLAVDFQGGASTSNVNESDSWVPRLREAWLSYTRSDLGLTILGGQAWSLLTFTRVGMSPLNANTPQTIDPSYVSGFDWARQAQFRVEESFLDKAFWLGLSVENPQTTYSQTSIPSKLGTLNVSNAGIGVDATTLSYTTNFAPDVIIKGVADTKIAHLEAFGLGRVFNDRVSQLGTGQSKTVIGGGGGGAALVRIIPNFLELDISGMAGQGIGRYGTSQLPDATVGSEGQPRPLPEWSAVAGIVGHPDPMIDVYGYIGTEQLSARYFDTDVKGKITGYGYGNPLYVNSGCNVELSTLTCVGNTSGVVTGAVGAWYRFLKGPLGTAQAGVQYTYTHRDVFQGVGPTPQTDDNMVFVSLRYFPFQ